MNDEFSWMRTKKRLRFQEIPSDTFFKNKIENDSQRDFKEK